MKSIKRLIAVALVSSVLVSCEKEQFPFTDVARVQFGPEQSLFYNPNANLADTLKNYTFIYAGNKTIDTVYFDLYATGGVSDQDRIFTLKQVQFAGANNAVAGQHYKAFDNELMKNKYFVKAGQVHARVPIIVYRDASLKTKDVVLKFQVQENANFKLGEATNLWRKLTLSDRLGISPQWNTGFYKFLLGGYSTVKHQFLIDHTGQLWSEEWMKYSIENDPGSVMNWVAIAKTALVDYNNAHPLDKLKDENGVLIVFP
ncbi:DUF4843 domain-containing protein [Solitalea sp. MAHUQ-68]|uniref:DUF4843 domain-containing protein n=1 Tax=Solitalea agri TaxID=2953739 RepID=A0A9X2JDE6_9SPHI|nr:DUF4843 domain-containing protein [Solitalea agri]MCO4294053.1 DUF4843 domain-containing protein [Solitalea agri]